MRKRTFILFAIIVTLLASIVCGGACAAAEAGNEPAARTILLWAGGAMMEDPYSGLITARLNKMMDAEIPDSVNIIVLTGGTLEGWSEELSLEGADSVRTDCNQVWRMKGARDGQRGAMALLEENGLPGAEQGPMTDPATLKAFIDYGVSNFPAEKYDLILISHGGGPACGWGMDDVFRREDGIGIMSVSEICGALKESAVDRFDILCFYACLMGSVEDAVMFSPYVDTLVFSEENLPGTGIEFNGMLEMLREDPAADSFQLGKRIADDTIDVFSSVAKSQNATLSVISTENLVKRLVPEMAALAEILYHEAADVTEDGEYAFYDEFLSIAKSVEFGTSRSPGYQLFDLGDFVTALGIAESEFNRSSDVRNLTNAYTDVSVRIMNILNDRDGSGDDVLYNRDTVGMHKFLGSAYTRDTEGKLVYGDGDFIRTTGLSIFFDMEKTCYPVTYSRNIDAAVALGDLDGESVRFLQRYRDAVQLYALIQGSGKAVYELRDEGLQKITVSNLLAAWEKAGIAVYDNSALRGMLPDAGLKDILEIAGSSGFDVNSWLERIAAQQATEIMNGDQVSVRRKESGKEQDADGSYRLISERLSARQLNGLYMRVMLKADYPYNLMKMFDYSEEYVPFGAHYLAGSVSSDLLMPALFTGETGGDFYRLVYGSRTALEIGLYDGQWYALKDAEGKLYLVQVYLDPNDPNRIQVPVAFNLDKKYGVTTSGLLQFVFEGEKETPALGLVLKKIPLDYGEGCEPLNQELFTGSVFQTRGFLKPGTVDINLSPELRLDGTESGGFTLVRVPFSEVELIKDAKAEYYLRDIYGNELVLTEAFSAAENEPLLKNLAFAEAKVDDGTVTVTCGGKTLDADLDYMVYTKDGEILIQGIGEYAGSIVLDNAE